MNMNYVIYIINKSKIGRYIEKRLQWIITLEMDKEAIFRQTIIKTMETNLMETREDRIL